MQDQPPADLFRRISVIYGREGVADLCLQLQYDHGFDVSLGLCALVDGLQGRCWSGNFVEELRRTGWDERATITKALRQVRHLAKPLAATDPAVAALRAAVLRQELEAERIAVAWLETILPHLPGGTTDEEAPLVNLRHVAGAEVPHHLLERLVALARS
jgi:uncharacterized protein (TIGR02444 family)